MKKKSLVYMPNLLLIGSSGRNSGKTTLACSIISRFKNKYPVIGLKVTTIADKKGPCPRGSQDCGVCSSLKGDFCITEEKDHDKGKDTALLLSAGAHRVFWLRVLLDRLPRGANAILKRLPKKGPVVAESNRLRLAVKPGLFLMVENTRTKAKQSARVVWEYADRIVHSKDSGFDLNLQSIAFQHNTWKLK